jgi:hypothetical protein
MMVLPFSVVSVWIDAGGNKFRMRPGRQAKLLAKKGSSSASTRPASKRNRELHGKQVIHPPGEINLPHLGEAKTPPLMDEVKPLCLYIQINKAPTMPGYKGRA